MIIIDPTLPSWEELNAKVRKHVYQLEQQIIGEWIVERLGLLACDIRMATLYGEGD